LFGKEVGANRWKVLGFDGTSLLESIEAANLQILTVRFKPEEMDEMCSEWERIKHYCCTGLVKLAVWQILIPIFQDFVLAFKLLHSAVMFVGVSGIM
jgi:hypothetical protein